MLTTSMHVKLRKTHLPQVLDDRFEALGSDFEKLGKVPYHGTDQKRLETDLRPDDAARRPRIVNGQESSAHVRADGDSNQSSGYT